MQGSEPAFPRACFESDHFKDEGADGMSTRLYVAKGAMEALIAKCPMYRLADEARAKELPTMSDVDGKNLRDGIALIATQYADALIAACKETT